MTERRRELDEIRRQMAEADLRILRALEERARLARQVGQLRSGSPPTIPAHEADQFDALEKAAGEELPASAIRSVFREVHAATLALESKVRVAYTAPEGGLAHLAALRQFGAGAELLVAEGASGAVEEVSRKRADFAVIPFESSLEGTLHTSVEAIAATDLVLVAKVETMGTLSLMSREGELVRIGKIYVDAADRVACHHFLSTMPAGTVIVEVASPALACQLSQEDEAGAAVVPEAFGAIAGLKVVSANIGEKADWSIRFGIVSNRPAIPSGQDTTAFLFGVHDQPGALFDVLKHFAERGVSLKTIQSRPAAGERWNYLFYVEIAGHVTDRSVITALEAIKRQTRFLKVLGSFPTC